jgi:hypothetical protein
MEGRRTRGANRLSRKNVWKCEGAEAATRARGPEGTRTREAVQSETRGRVGMVTRGQGAYIRGPEAQRLSGSESGSFQVAGGGPRWRVAGKRKRLTGDRKPDDWLGAYGRSINSGLRFPFDWLNRFGWQVAAAGGGWRGEPVFRSRVSVDRVSGSGSSGAGTGHNVQRCKRGVAACKSAKVRDIQTGPNLDLVLNT